jgi:tetratricopeptide (TPR) repeat protein
VTRALEPEWSPVSPDSTVPIARRLAERAIGIDSTESRAWEALGYVRLTYDWDLAGAEAAFRTAMRHDPLAVNAQQWLGLTLVAARRHPEARDALRRAIELDPTGAAIHSNYAIALQSGAWPDARQGRDSAIAHLREALALPGGQDAFLYQYYLAHLLVLQGADADAETELRAAGRLVGDADVYLPLLEGWRDPAKRGAARRLLRGWSESPGTSRLPLVFLAGWYTLFGESTAALDLLERGARERVPFMTYLDGVGLQGLDAEPRYQSVRARVGLE